MLDYNKSEAKLLHDKNPFALIVLSQLKAMETRSDPEARSMQKFYLVRQLYNKGYTKEDVIQLFSFIDWVMSLPQEFSMRFWNNVISFEEEYKMPYVTSVERIGIEKGMQQGLQKGMLQGMQQGIIKTTQENIIDILELRFGKVPSEVVDQVNRISDSAKLKELLKMCIRIKDITELKFNPCPTT